MAQALQHDGQEHQLGFFAAAETTARRERTARAVPVRHGAPLCAGCRAKEARYGFRRHDDDPSADRPRTLCFECFRVELAHRQAMAARAARGWNAAQVPLPLDEKLRELHLRRRRAQIAARKALGL